VKVVFADPVFRCGAYQRHWFSLIISAGRKPHPLTITVAARQIQMPRNKTVPAIDPLPQWSFTKLNQKSSHSVKQNANFCLRLVQRITRVVHGTYLSVPFPSHPMERFPWDSHRNDIPMDKSRVVHETYLSVPLPSHSNLCLSHPIPWDVSHGIPIGMTFPWTSLRITTNTFRQG